MRIHKYNGLDVVLLVFALAVLAGCPVESGNYTVVSVGACYEDVSVEQSTAAAIRLTIVDGASAEMLMGQFLLLPPSTKCSELCSTGSRYRFAPQEVEP